MQVNKKKILILTGDAGLGHRSASEAIQKAFQLKYDDQCETTIENPLNHPNIPDFIRDSQSDYDEIVKAIPEIYKLGYKISDANFPVRLMEEGFNALFLNILREVVHKEKPDLVITTYPIYSAPLGALFKMDGLQIPLMATVTDLVTVHHVWFNDSITLCTVPTEIVRQRALEAGLSEQQVINIGIPVDPQIDQLKDLNVTDLREELGLEKDLTTILVVGSPRVPSLIEILKTIDFSGYDFQFVLVAGGNDSLLTQFQQTDWHHPATVYDFIDFMPKLMRAADMIISKAGGLITTESLASGLPMMIVHVLPGQERGNVGYVVENGAGELCETPLEVIETLCKWLENDQVKLKEATKNAESLGHAKAAMIIADEAWNLID